MIFSRSILHPPRSFQRCIFGQKSFRNIDLKLSTSGAIKRREYLDYLRVEDETKAKQLALHLQPDEQRRLFFALEEQIKSQHNTKVTMTREQTRQLCLINAVPFIGFGFLDNFIMIIAGEYIDQTIGAWFTLSTMAAAALGNTISDVSGVGLAHYVEGVASKFGVTHPELTAAQLNSKFARAIVNISRGIGLIIGCIIGMFPLAFFKKSEKSLD